MEHSGANIRQGIRLAIRTTVARYLPVGNDLGFMQPPQCPVHALVVGSYGVFGRTDDPFLDLGHVFATSLERQQNPQCQLTLLVDIFPAF